MQKQPFPFSIEVLPLGILLFLLMPQGWVVTFLGMTCALISWFAAGENGFYHGYIHHKE